MCTALFENQLPLTAAGYGKLHENDDGDYRRTKTSKRSFTRLSRAEEENGQSRIYLGIHWAFDKVQGIAQGRRVGDYVFDHAFRPLHGKHR